MSKTDLAWAAGFIDGEGCIRIAKTNTRDKISKRYSLMITAPQTDSRPIYKLQKMFGGTITEYDKGIYKKQWCWKVAAHASENVLNHLLPYFVVKGEQAQIALEFQSVMNANQSRKRRTPERLELMEMYYIKIKELKKVNI